MGTLVFTPSTLFYLMSEAPPTKSIQERSCSRYTQLNQTMKHYETQAHFNHQVVGYMHNTGLH